MAQKFPRDMELPWHIPTLLLRMLTNQLTHAQFMENRYSAIIRLPHHVSAYHRPMPMIKRAAQFAPFAALEGYAAATEEARRQTEASPVPDENRDTLLNRKIAYLQMKLRQGNFPPLRITWFQTDSRKSGGQYQQTVGQLTAIRIAAISAHQSDSTSAHLSDSISAHQSDITSAHQLVLSDGSRITTNTIIGLDSPIFDEISIE